MKILTLANISKNFGNISVIKNFDLELEKGNILTLLGKSGCGKSTVLRMIAGLEDPNDGVININLENVYAKGVNVSTQARDIGFVFQDYALFPHMSVFDNISFGLNAMSKQAKKTRVDELISMFELDGHTYKFPHELSGGQQQRVAVARALANKPSLILLDEPFSNIDANLKNKLCHDLKKIFKQSGTTAIFVTHDQKEALMLSDKIAVLNEGSIEQFGTTKSVYENPINYFVANFFGKVNVLEENESYLKCIRAEDVKICHEHKGIKSYVQSINYLGNKKEVVAKLKSCQTPVQFFVDADERLDENEKVRLHFKEERIIKINK